MKTYTKNPKTKCLTIEIRIIICSDCVCFKSDISVLVN